jgi:Holliday junction resolvase
MNAKRKGTRNEHRSIALLESAGYRCSRSAASLGVFDVIGIGPADVVLVQVKTRDWPGREEMERLRAFSAPANCRKLVHRWRDRQGSPDVRELVNNSEAPATL